MLYVAPYMCVNVCLDVVPFMLIRVLLPYLERHPVRKARKQSLPTQRHPRIERFPGYRMSLVLHLCFHHAICTDQWRPGHNASAAQNALVPGRLRRRSSTAGRYFTDSQRGSQWWRKFEYREYDCRYLQNNVCYLCELSVVRKCDQCAGNDPSVQFVVVDVLDRFPHLLCSALSHRSQQFAGTKAGAQVNLHFSPCIFHLVKMPDVYKNLPGIFLHFSLLTSQVWLLSLFEHGMHFYAASVVDQFRQETVQSKGWYIRWWWRRRLKVHSGSRRWHCATDRVFVLDVSRITKNEEKGKLSRD